MKKDKFSTETTLCAAWYLISGSNTTSMQPDHIISRAVSTDTIGPDRVIRFIKEQSVRFRSSCANAHVF